ncbi:HDIG domain-containing protein [Alkalibacter rhizosphaerae]|uniref:HDIG domain-containing protein n=1 Tax=Alkalibacter rhizosphaerae TaxID=2815577 RepID=A0A975AI77_9FIRM|nr:HDIG domain-containing metalloprotein [Alkalibacter rhizosphaerae]QSX08394.1 HDIG domain-containing protein [Alkalibacter rhizosphaerae]
MIMAFVGLLSIYIALVLIALPPNYNYKQGDVATESIYAPNMITDMKTTERLQDQAAASVEQVYTKMEDVQENVLENVGNFFSLINGSDVLEPNILQQAKTEHVNLSDAASRQLLEMDLAMRRELQDQTEKTLKNLYQDEISIQNLTEKRAEAEALLGETNPLLKGVALEIVQGQLQPNMILDVDRTQEAVAEARSKVQTVTYEEGDMIVEEGEVLTAEKIDLLVDNNMMRNSYLDDPYLMIGVFLLMLAIFIVFYIYLNKFYKASILKDRNRMAILVILFTFTVLLTVFLAPISPYLVPVSMMTMTIALLTDRRLAITSTVFFVIIAAFGAELNTLQIALYLVNGYIGALGMLKITKRADVMRTGLYVSIINLLMIGAYNLMTHQFALSGIVNMGLGFANGIVSAIITLGTMVIWEYAFDITTPIMLMELANPNNPLLKKLMNNAPGTYHHSIIVGNLAESAAEKIGANALLVRVGAYYHDIGKSLSPVYFTENQMGDVNPHDYISPEKSVQIIKNHVSKGYEMAKEGRIPFEVRNFILTHHGDSTIDFFLHKATENNENPEVGKYRYEAHRPVTKEEGILALADSVEAAVRSIKGINEEKIVERVEAIFKKKLGDGMLDFCDLSLKEVNIIKEIFIKILNSVYHQRVEYPTMETKKEDA